MSDLVLIHIRLTRELRDWLVAEAERRTRAEGHYISANDIVGEAVMGLRKAQEVRGRVIKRAEARKED